MIYSLTGQPTYPHFNIQPNTMKIIKRDGSKEDFLPEKIIRVLLAAGLEEDSALVVSTNVTKWVKEQKHHELTSIQIRDRVISELGKVDPYIAGLFTWYQQSKDKMYGQQHQK